ncbi:probable polygalacturonase At1g80170 [Setaria viridis]|nr:probable polygalacturonase At1g80170 [Setaria viridis]
MWTVIVVLAGLALGCGAVDNAGGELVFDVVDHGARGDGITDDTKAFEAAWTAACGAKAPSASMVVPPQRSFLVGPVSFQGPCASERITVQIQGNIVAPPSTAANTWTSVRNNYWLMFSRVAQGDRQRHARRQRPKLVDQDSGDAAMS